MILASAAVPYAGVIRIRFQGLLSGRLATPRLWVVPNVGLWSGKVNISEQGAGGQGARLRCRDI
jgi:hypothetical protein